VTSENLQDPLLTFDEALSAYFRDIYGLDDDQKTFVRRILDNCLEQVERASFALDDEISLYFYSLKFTSYEQDKLSLNSNFILDCIHVYERFLEANRAPDEAVYFVNQIWSTFSISTLALKLYWQASTDRKNCDNVSALISGLKNLLLFPQAQVFNATMNGNRSICFNNDDDWDWYFCDELISEFIASGVKSNLISWSLLRYRIGTETWAFHKECMHSFSALARGETLTNSNGYSNSLADDIERAIELNYNTRAIRSANSKRLFVRQAVAEVCAFGIGAALLYVGFSNHLEWMTAIGAIFCGYIFIINIVGPLRWLGLFPQASLKDQKSTTLSLRNKMIMFTRDVSESSVDLAETITQMRTLKSEGAALPAVLVALLHNSVTQNTVHFDVWNMRN